MQAPHKESGIIFIALFVVIIIGAIISALFFIAQQQRGSEGKDTQIKIESTINL